MNKMEAIAREATRQALSMHPKPPESEQANWTLGKFETDDEGIFEIYIPSERPLDAKVISTAKVNRRTGEVSVEIFL
ncbi:hypothetical protein J5226_11415 [Lysobacter sp. K5869]|uniref:hypothetical protein n=1 Tax=Lysobacter sp. K5869 TaxID=2820808 RepID=UPI001C060656|nr:hypothetical protein [Lysobacter sp. K5869]QWP78951.1 hypothetical protein J5226_11415 [Lysobacter sp. K5869]